MREALSVAAEHRLPGFELRASFSAPAGVTALFGRSGSGKTTLVNVIAGLVRPRRGRVTLAGTDLVDTARGLWVPPHRRRVGYVFQEARLFPHLSVRQNLSFGRWFAPRREPGPDLDQVVELLGIGHLLGRRPAGLSGGERQRVAIGRALLAKPRLLLMDEPLAALDDSRKGEILPYIERLRDEAGLPIVYVSHSLPEVARLADTLVVVEDGRVAAAGAAADILAGIGAGSLLGERDAGAVLAAEVARHDGAYGLTVLSTPAGDLLVPRIERAPGTRLRIRISARDVMLTLARPDGLSALNVLPGRVAAVATDPADVASAQVRIACGEAAIVALITRRSLDRLGLAPGTPVHAVVKSVALAEGRPPLAEGRPSMRVIGEGMGGDPSPLGGAVPKD